MNYAYLGKRIREERCRLNMTQADLAAAVEVSPAYIGQIERGEKNATLDKMIKISNSLHVTLDYLLQDYVEDRDDNINRLILQFLHTKSVPEKEMAYRMLLAVFDCYETTQPHTESSQAVKTVL
ncbi:MAG: helix-turn-helix domain-containing protein [Lachnospiraceae bacterium]|nr:helix-turn-helix domain-containing protein [Lachnospiraceae bacterium]